jgi:hypothetical protein
LTIPKRKEEKSPSEGDVQWVRAGIVRRSVTIGGTTASIGESSLGEGLDAEDEAMTWLHHSGWPFIKQEEYHTVA